MYLDYWKLNRQPFDNVPDPSMYFDMHVSVEEAVSEVLYAIEEGNECLAVVVGEVGVGKTMSLRIVLNALDPARYRIAFVTNPDLTFTQMLSEIIGQLEGDVCAEKRRDRLFERFNRLLFQSSDQGRKVVVFIDEGNVIKPHNLDSLRLLTNMQDDEQNLFTIVLAGQPELARRLEDPRRENLFQRVGVYCKIQGIRSRETMKDYIEHRLERAGLSGDSPFTEAAYDALWANSENGVPRLINKLCKLSLKAAETNEVRLVDAPIVEAVAARFARTYRRIVAASRRRKPASAELPAPAEAPAKPLTDADREQLASQLATDRIRSLLTVPDPFEAWSKAREEILAELQHGMLPVPALAHAG